jgi:hypothetical protein
MLITVYDKDNNIISSESYSKLTTTNNLEQSIYSRANGQILKLKPETTYAIRSPEATRVVIQFTVRNTGTIPIFFNITNNEFIGVQQS